MIKLTGTVDPRHALAIYLRDHHAGSQAGLALARRAAGNQRGTHAGEVLTQLVRDIEQDEEVLLRVMAQFDTAPDPLKSLGAKAVERLGRLKLNGQVLGSSPLSPVIEMELLLSGIKSKQHVWILLRDAVDVPIRDVDLDRMIERAEDQLDRLHELWVGFARRAFPGDGDAD